jgi:hypothetical protein
MEVCVVFGPCGIVHFGRGEGEEESKQGETCVSETCPDAHCKGRSKGVTTLNIHEAAALLMRMKRGKCAASLSGVIHGTRRL